MVLLSIFQQGFLKHVYRYFQPAPEKPQHAVEPQTATIQPQMPLLPPHPLYSQWQPQPRADVQGPASMVPCYNEVGIIVAYRSVFNPNYNSEFTYPAPTLGMRLNSVLSPFPKLIAGQPSNPRTIPTQSSSQLPIPSNFTGQAQYLPSFPSPWGFPHAVPAYPESANPIHAQTDGVADRARQPGPVTSAHSEASPPRPQPLGPNSASSSSEHLPSPAPSAVNLASDNMKSRVTVQWSPWPDGDFECDFTWEEFHATGGLPVHWACESPGGYKRGCDTADEWCDGKKTGRRCRGIIHCSKSCGIIVRPQTRMRGIQKQLLERCKCKARLIHQDCRLVSTLYSFSGGVHYVNGGKHDHPKPTHLLHLTPNERDKFTSIVEDHPKVGPLALLVGRPGLHGHEKSVADISPVLFNKDRIKSERRAVKRRGNSNSDFAEFAQFERDNPGFIIFSQFGTVTVIVMQTPFMVSQLVKNHIILRDAINGIVSDGAHGYFIEHNALLLMSSSYCLDLDCWVPGIMSYTNGATQQHFCLHFLAMFETMASYAESQGIKISDSSFKNVVDFSDPERLGFVDAFVLFWQRRKDDFRTEKELRKAASALLKGCQQHYRAQVNRVKKISAVVAPGLQDVFSNEAMALIDAEDYDDFTQRTERLIKKFPKVEGWARWWAREPHAKMLFKGLLQLAHHYHLLANAVSSGIPIRYGHAEPWKHGAGRASRQKGKGRSSRKDGRPPDTAKELAGDDCSRRRSSSAHKDSVEPPSIVVIPAQRPSYSWNRNSCYLDTSLELIFQTVLPRFEHEFGSRSGTLHNKESIKKLFELMSLRWQVERNLAGSSTSDVIGELVRQRDKFRKFLLKAPIVTDPYIFNPLFGWLEAIISHQHDREQNFARAYFQSYFVSLRTCPGDEQTRSHLHLRCLHPAFNYNLTAELHGTYQGDVERWFRTIVRVDRDPERAPVCWRNVDDNGASTCSGAATLLPLLLGIPVMLILEIPGEWGGNQPPQWDFPKHIRPLTAGAETVHGVVYDIVGRAFSNGGHFKAVFTPDGENTYSYDDTRHGGHSVLTTKKDLIGKIAPKSGWRTYAVVYRLRGGARAQAFFTRSQTAAARRLHSIVFSASSSDTIPNVVGFDLPNLTELTGEERFWLRNPWRTDVLDFISTRPALRKRRVRFADEDQANEADNEVGSDSPRPAKRRRSARSAVVLSDDEDSALPDIATHASVPASGDHQHNDSDDPDLEMDCRCGQQGGGQNAPELLVKCTLCLSFSHIACQRNGEASTPKGRENFRCFTCQPPAAILGINRTEPKKRKKKQPDNPPRTSLSKRLISGKGALARHGEYWYPVRLIVKRSDGWEVQWWRGNQYSEPMPPPSKISDDNLRDELWANADARRKIKLGKWTHACETATEEDEVFEFRQAAYTDEIESALRPHIDTLQRLVDDPDGYYPNVPAAVYARQQETADTTKGTEMLRHGGIPYTGNLPSIDCARIANWVYHCVSGAKNSVVKWMGRVPLAHAYLILIAYRNQADILTEIEHSAKHINMDRQAAIFDIAWRYQKRPGSFRFVDVDHECLNIFEERLFEYSLAAGRAGNQQWGLDVGPHQDNWNPYSGTPTHWNHDDRDNQSESELLHGPHYGQLLRSGTGDTKSDSTVRPRKARAPRRTPRALN
ncbi:hypothetical protein C8R47DRAFT_1203316 [Mycena vitilis]|nr:hypothetical protein C8R47DRAFT_1203316 [Mycena vitilis]